MHPMKFAQSLTFDYVTYYVASKQMSHKQTLPILHVVYTYTDYSVQTHRHTKGLDLKS